MCLPTPTPPETANFNENIDWQFSLSEPVIELINRDPLYPDEEYVYPDEWNPADTLIIKMELCNNTDEDFMYYPSAILVDPF